MAATTKLNDRRDYCVFFIVNFPFICSNISATLTYGVYISNRYDITEFVQQHLHMVYIYLNRYDITEFVQQHLHIVYLYLNRYDITEFVVSLGISVMLLTRKLLY